jgi:hypothetical protein
MIPSYPAALAFLLVACAPEAAPAEDAGPGADPTQPPRRQRAVPMVGDAAVAAGVANLRGQEQRGRACVAVDFDEDGWIDLYTGNPGDASYVKRNLGGDGEGLRFSEGNLLVRDRLAWSAAAADGDGDGFVDLWIGGGGNEGIDLDFMFRNLAGEGTPEFQDVTLRAGTGGGMKGNRMIPVTSANAAWGDVDLDGDNDLFVNGNIPPGGAPRPFGVNQLWLNDGTSVFEDGAASAGLATHRARTRHSALVDLDNDGDLDVYENNYLGRNILWLNQLVETGTLRFIDATGDFAARGADVGTPFASFASASADLNNDGFLDLVVFTRSARAGDCVDVSEADPDADPLLEGHWVFLNDGGRRFVDVTGWTGINQRLVGRAGAPMGGLGVMGCQLADIDADGLLDVYIGNGGPSTGETDDLYVAAELRPVELDGATLMVPIYEDWTSLVDYPSATGAAPYPYRTHGTCIADFDNDGFVEVYVTNGGTADSGDEVQEPDRLFDLTFPADSRPDTLRLALVGDGVHVDTHGLGAWVDVDVVDEAGALRTIHRRVASSQGFSAQNGFDVHVGLGFATKVPEVRIRWLDGTRQVLRDVPLNTRQLVTWQATADGPGAPRRALAAPGHHR